MGVYDMRCCHVCDQRFNGTTHSTYPNISLSGEAVIQLVQAQGNYDAFSYVRAVLGFAIVFNVGNVYYEQQQREPHK